MTRRRNIPVSLAGAWGWVYEALRREPEARRIVLNALAEVPAPSPGEVDRRVREAVFYQQGLESGLVRR